jgi:preprotein translocase subunit Sec63
MHEAKVCTAHTTGSHPDKLQLAENQTKEDADAHFVDLTKAYKTCASHLPAL